MAFSTSRSRRLSLSVFLRFRFFLFRSLVCSFFLLDETLGEQSKAGGSGYLL